MDPLFDDGPSKVPGGVRHVRSRRPSTCPRCKSRKMAGIQYRMPIMTPELAREMAEGRVTPGGCCMSGDVPAWECVDCGERVWRKEPGR